MTTTTDFDLMATTRRLIADLGEPDPGVIASKLQEEIPLEARDDVLGGLLRTHVRLVMAKVRRDNRKRGRRSEGSSSKWDSVRDIFSDSYYTGAEWKFLGDLNVTECEAVRDDYFALAAENEAIGQRFDLLVTELRNRHKGRVRDLPLDLVEGIFSDDE